MKLDGEDGWMEWVICAPFLEAPIQIQRCEWDRPAVIYPNDLPYEANAFGLFWKKTGIYRNLEEGMAWPARQQMNANFMGYGNMLMLGSLLGSGLNAK